MLVLKGIFGGSLKRTLEIIITIIIFEAKIASKDS